jgi:APA family basic amino acid/polyamine antiporter
VNPVRRDELGAADAVLAGLGATIGAGLFAGLAPASSLAGRWSLLAVVIAAVAAAYCCRSTAGADGGRAAVGLHLAGRAAAAAAIAGCFGDYVAPDRPVLPALGLLLCAVAADALGLRPSVALTRVLTVFVLLVLVVVVAACFAIAPPPPTGVPIPPGTPGLDDPGGLLPAAGVLFFAFLGSGRVTAPGADQPIVARRRLRIVVPVLLSITLGTYLAVAAGVLRQLGPTRLAVSTAPLRDALDAADGTSLDPLVTLAAIVATGTVLLLVLGGARVTDGDSSAWREVVVRGLVGGGAVVGVLVATPAELIGLAATCALFHYAGTARPLSWPVWLGVGLLVLIGITMPVPDLAVVLGVLVLATVSDPRFVRRRAVRR